jgi:hypothetical protein
MIDIATLQAALVGYEAELRRIDSKIAEIRKALRLKGKAALDGAGGVSTPLRKRRTLSAAARKRIAAAQRKRWAEYHKKQKA